MDSLSVHTHTEKEAKGKRNHTDIHIQYVFCPNEILVRARSHCLRSPLNFWMKFWSIRSVPCMGKNIGVRCALPSPFCASVLVRSNGAFRKFLQRKHNKYVRECVGTCYTRLCDAPAPARAHTQTHIRSVFAKCF